MPDVTVVFWRDIPAQVIVGKGRSGSKVQLPERFEQAFAHLDHWVSLN